MSLVIRLFFFFKQKTAYEIKECDWSSDVCSSDLEKLSAFLHSHSYTGNALACRAALATLDIFSENDEIGRASCRERV